MEAGKLEKHLRDSTEVQKHCLKSENCVHASCDQHWCSLALLRASQAWECAGEGGRYAGVLMCVGVRWKPGWGRWQGALDARLAGSRV